jgi:hypothetical protein
VLHQLAYLFCQNTRFSAAKKLARFLQKCLREAKVSTTQFR